MRSREEVPADAAGPSSSTSSKSEREGGPETREDAENDGKREAGALEDDGDVELSALSGVWATLEDHHEELVLEEICELCAMTFEDIRDKGHELPVCEDPDLGELV